MKKFLSVFLSLCVLMFAACACAGGNTDTGSDNKNSAANANVPVTDVNISQYASEGRISGFTLGLGNVMGDVRAQFLGDDSLKFEDKGGFYTLIGGKTKYYIDKDTYKVVGVLTSEQTYGIKESATPDEMAAYLGQPAATATPTEAAAVYGSDAGDRLSQTYNFGSYTLTFYFLSGKIYATLIYPSDVSLTSVIGG